MHSRLYRSLSWAKSITRIFPAKVSPSAVLFATLVPAGMIGAGGFAPTAAAKEPPYETSVVFTPDDFPGGGGVHLPSLLVLQKGTVVAACQHRKGSTGDWGHDVDILFRRSVTGGKTWLPPQLLYTETGVNGINGPMVEDRTNGKLILAFTKLPSTAKGQPEWVGNFGDRGGSIWITTSADEGVTWSPPIETKPVGAKGWIAWPGNSAHGVQLPDGRLVIPGFAHRHVDSPHKYHALQESTCLLLSDDHGATWRIGAIAPFPGTDEESVAICSDGNLFVSVRMNNRSPIDLVRFVARSRDRGESFVDCGLQDHLSLCNDHAGLASLVDNSTGSPRYILIHTGPQGGGGPNVRMSRSQLAVRVSYDDGRTWPVARMLIDPRRNAEYSDAGVAADGTLLCLYDTNPFDKVGAKVELVRFSLASVEEDFDAYRQTTVTPPK